jgi:acyl carrier protein
MLQSVEQQLPDPETLNRLLDVIAKEGIVDRDKLLLDSTLDSLGLKSADVVVVLMAVEEQFGVYIPLDDTLSEAKNLREFIAAIALHLQKSKP